MWENIVGGRPQVTIWRMRIACWIQTHSKYVIIFAFLLQKYLPESASTVR